MWKSPRTKLVEFVQFIDWSFFAISELDFLNKLIEILSMDSRKTITSILDNQNWASFVKWIFLEESIFMNVVYLVKVVKVGEIKSDVSRYFIVFI